MLMRGMKAWPGLWTVHVPEVHGSRPRLPRTVQSRFKGCLFVGHSYYAVCKDTQRQAFSYPPGPLTLCHGSHTSDMPVSLPRHFRQSHSRLQLRAHRHPPTGRWREQRSCPLHIAFRRLDRRRPIVGPRSTATQLALDGPENPYGFVVLITGDGRPVQPSANSVARENSLGGQQGTAPINFRQGPTGLDGRGDSLAFGKQITNVAKAHSYGHCFRRGRRPSPFREASTQDPSLILIEVELNPVMRIHSSSFHDVDIKSHSKPLTSLKRQAANHISGDREGDAR